MHSALCHSTIIRSIHSVFSQPIIHSKSNKSVSNIIATMHSALCQSTIIPSINSVFSQPIIYSKSNMSFDHHCIYTVSLMPVNHQWLYTFSFQSTNKLFNTAICQSTIIATIHLAFSLRTYHSTIHPVTHSSSHLYIQFSVKKST